MNKETSSKKSEKSSRTLLGAGLLTAFAASLCCITPVLALFSGATGAASIFSGMEPYRPYLIGITIAVLAFAWYQKLKPKKAEPDCACEKDKPSFWQSKRFLGIVTVLALLLMTFPSYSKLFFPKASPVTVIDLNKSDIQQVKLDISGMDCQACTHTVNLALSKLPGVLAYSTGYKAGRSLVKFDHSKTSREAIINAVNRTGYKVNDTNPIR